MKLTVLNSGSSANGYLLHSESEAVVIECGCPVLACEKLLHFNVKKVNAVLCSHEHQDHARYLEKYADYMPVYASSGTIEALGLDGLRNINPLEMLRTYTFGRFQVLAFPVQHDAKAPCGFLIKHPDFGTLLFATDTYYLRYRFPGLSYIMLECNYDIDLLNKNVEEMVVSKSVRDRVIRSHLSLKTCISTLLANDLSEVKGIMLIHLSDNNSNRDNFIKQVQLTTGRYVVAAEKGLEIELL